MDEISNYMKGPLFSIDGESSITDVAKFMLDKNVTKVLVNEKGRGFVGVLSDVDITRRVVAKELDPQKIKATTVMSHPIYSLEKGQMMDEAFLCMQKNHIRHIHITDNNKIVGTLSVKDFADYFKKKFDKRDDPITEFWKNYDALLDVNYFRSSLGILLQDFRKTLTDSSPTAQSIDKKEPLAKIAQSARDEKFLDLAEILEVAQAN